MSNNENYTNMATELLRVVAGLRTSARVCYQHEDLEGVARCWHAISKLAEALAASSILYEKAKAEADEETRKQYPAMPVVDPWTAMVGDSDDQSEDFAAFHLKAIAHANEHAGVWPIDPMESIECAQTYFLQQSYAGDLEPKRSKKRSLPARRRRGKVVTVEQTFKLGPEHRLEADGDLSIDGEEYAND
jgi:hypothetical protein